MKIIVTTRVNPSDELVEKAKKIALELGISYSKRFDYTVKQMIQGELVDYVIVVEQERLVLRSLTNEFFWHPSTVKLKWKSIEDGFKNHLINAMDLQLGDQVLDCTLGLATESILISLIVGESGKVVGLEGSEIIALLTKEGLMNFEETNPLIKSAMQRIDVISSNYSDYLRQQDSNSFDVVYFDPMFQIPKSKQNPIDSLRELTITLPITKEIIQEALRVCRKRVVMKERYEISNFNELGFTHFEGDLRKGSIVYGYINK